MKTTLLFYIPNKIVLTVVVHNSQISPSHEASQGIFCGFSVTTISLHTDANQSYSR